MTCMKGRAKADYISGERFAYLLSLLAGHAYDFGVGVSG
jgi:hypothetical protein